MSAVHFRYVVVGGGAAGSAAAAAIRRQDPIGSILFVGQENTRPYRRAALNKQYLRRELSRYQIFSEPVGAFAEMRIDLRTGRRVSHLDLPRHALTLDNGEEIAFDKLLLTIGASPRPLGLPGSDLPSLFYLRSLEDCDRLSNAVDKARREGRPHPGTFSPTQLRGRGLAVVLGSGPLAVESAASLSRLGLHVEIATARPWLLAKIAGQTAGRFVERTLARHGIGIHTDAPPVRLEGDGRVQQIVLASGTVLACDLVLAASGAVISREVLRGTPIAAESAILVDAGFHTSVPDVFAAGDCAAVLDARFGKHRVIDHWEAARASGAIAGANMAGANLRYAAIDGFACECFEQTIHFWGEGRLVHHRLVRGTAGDDAPEFAEIGISADGKVTQVLTVGRETERNALLDLLRQRTDVTGQEEQLKDPAAMLPTAE